MSPTSAELANSWREKTSAPRRDFGGGPPSGGTVLHARVVTGTGGGPEKTILHSPRFLAPLGFRAMCAFMHPPNDPGFEELRRRGTALEAPVISIPDRGPLDVGVVTQFLQLCRRENVAIWHAHDYKSNLVGLLVRRSWPMHLVTTVHGWVQRTWKTPLYYRLDRWAQKRYDKVICVSSDLLETVQNAGVAKEKTLLIDNAIDTEIHRRTEPPQVMKARLGFRLDRLLIGAVGRLSGEKNFASLIQAVSNLLDQGHNVELAIAGDGAERENLERLVAAQREPERFHLLGFQSELKAFYQALDVFALSSLREGLPNVLLEAMAYQVPVAAANAGGIARLIENDHNGLLVPVAEIPALTGALAKLLSDRKRAGQLAANGRQTVEERFSFAARMQRMAAIYEELLSQ